jgi:hypothetical protein
LRAVTKQGFGLGKNLKDASSDALKRAAVEFGIGRYLYKSGVPEFALALFPGRPDHQEESSPRPSTNGTSARPTARNGGNGARAGGYPVSYDCPANGRRLFAWAKDMEQRLGVAVIQTRQQPRPA